MKKQSIITSILCAVLLWTCKPDFIAVDLGKTQVILKTPKDNLQTATLTHTFWWEEVEGANGYNIQVISPSFATPAVLELDSNIISNQYSLTLTPGVYEWQVRAYNGSSTTLYTTYTLTIDSTPDLSSQILVLISPINNLVTNQVNITFKWDTLYNADDYRIEIATPDFNGTQELAPKTEAGDSLTHTFSQEGVFQWRVRGQSSFSNTLYTTRTIEIDTTAPNVPILLSPANNDTLPDSTTTSFSWDRGVITGSTIMDSLYIYADTGMVTLVKSVYTANPSFTDSLGLANYYWRVISIDAANNKSGYSILRKFTIQ